jgi:nitrous oxide reductase
MNKNSFCAIVVVAVAAVTTLGIIYAIPTLSASAQSASSNQMTGSSSMNNTATSNAATMAMNASISDNVSSPNKNFYIFTTEVEGVNETKLGISGDIYSLQTMVVNKGDNVTVHFYNLEKDKDERHSFTIGAPYNINRDLAGGENATITFVADHEGVFQYHCLHHPPQMIGQLVVLPSAKATM